VTTSPLRTRLTVGLVALAVILFELTLIRLLGFRWWHHFAHMVIGVALLGFGASGTLLALLRRRAARDVGGWLAGLALSFSCGMPLGVLVAERLPLEVAFIAWSPRRELGGVGCLEAILFLPFLLGGGALGVSLLDRPERLEGHYAANLVGSGAGALLAIGLMWVLDERGLIAVAAGCAWLAGALLLFPHRLRGLIPLLGAGAVGVALLVSIPPEPPVSPYKMLAQARLTPGVRTLARARGPLGRIEVVEGRALHYAPGLSLQCEVPVPPHALIIVDGDQTSAVYDAKTRSDWAFMDWTTSAAAYALRPRPSTLVIGAGGGAEIGLALYHESPRVTAIEMNPQIIALMAGPLADRGGDIYERGGVTVVAREARGYLTRTRERFDVIQLPPIDAFGASGAGLFAAQESYLYTMESVGAMLDRLGERGLLCMTRWARTPPRDELRLFAMAAEALRRRGLDPAPRLAMLRSWATVTTLVSHGGFTEEDRVALRDFCRGRGFDLCWLSDIRPDEPNRFHVLEGPYYYDAASALLGPERESFTRRYLFDIRPATDDRPYFFHSFRWRAWSALRRRLGGLAPAFSEIGYLLLVAALAQAALLSSCLILVPLLPRLGALRGVPGKAWCLGYFGLIGAGFMLLEMGFLQKFILYLAHPVYAAAVSIAGFLVFAGIGSATVRYRKDSLRRDVFHTAIVLAAVVGLYLVGLGRWLSITQGAALGLRIATALATIAPLALLMGRFFPLGLRHVEERAPALVPWAWAVNGCASVLATVAAPLIAMEIGFARMLGVAGAAYAVTGLWTWSRGRSHVEQRASGG